MMGETLYNSLIKVDKVMKQLEIGRAEIGNARLRAETPAVPELRSALERGLLQKYGGNGVLRDAISGMQSVEDTLKALGKVNRGVRRFLPRPKSTYATSHNIRLRQLGELISEPTYLRRKGVLNPDNFVTAAALFLCMARAGEYFLPNFLMPDAPQSQFSLIPSEGDMILAPIFGFFLNINRFEKLPLERARYIDGKVSQFYR